MHQQKPLVIKNKKTTSGFSISVEQKTYPFSFPLNVWRAFPESRKQELIDTITVMATYHFAFTQRRPIRYDFPSVIGLSLYFHGLLYSLASTVYEFHDRPFTVPDLLKTAYNSNFLVSFSGTPKPIERQTPYRLKERSVLMPFSFGKDSLTTFALFRKFGFTVYPYYFQEPTSVREVQTKLQLKKKFEKQCNQRLYSFPLSLGNLRQGGGDMWGWDMLLAQYTLLLLPYVYFHKPALFAWSDEQALNGSMTDSDGYIINPTHDQNAQWVMHLNTLYRHFGGNTVITSVIEPLYDMMLLHMLHHEFSDIGTYQLSCDLPERPRHDHRWCGKCGECARQFILMLGMGINPQRVGLKENMLSLDKKHLHDIFTPKVKNGMDIHFQDKEEKLLAFYLAYRRGIRGGVMDLFETQYLKRIEKEEKQLTEKFFTPVVPQSIPEPLRTPLMTFYRRYGEKIKKELRKGQLAPVGKF